MDRRKDAVPESPREISATGWKATFKRTLTEFSAKGGTDLAAALTYYSVFSIFPAILAALGILSLFGQSDESVDAILGAVEEMGADQDQIDQIGSFITQMGGASGTGLVLLIGIGSGLWAASNYVNGFSRMMNIVYDVPEGRPVWKLRPWMLLITAIVVVMVLLVGLSLAFSGEFARQILAQVGLDGAFTTFWTYGKWPVMFLIVVTIVGILYWGTPNIRPPKFRWLSPGALFAITAWILATAGLGFYIGNFGNYEATYGALAGVIVMLLWLWITNTTLVFGAVLDAELERARELQAGLPSEEKLQLPQRDDRGSIKQAEKHESMVAESRRIRLNAEDAAASSGDASATSSNGSGADSRDR